MNKEDKLVDKILHGTSDANIVFEDLCSLLRGKGFTERIRGSHHIFTREDVEEILNLLSRGNLAKPYQVKQLRTMFIRYTLGGRDE